jgi:hypothetical protein
MTLQNINKCLLIIISFLLPEVSISQQSASNKLTIINSGGPITNEMIFYYPFQFAKNKKPLFFMNNRKVASIAYYNKDELKKVIVLQPKEAIKKFGPKGRNGAIHGKLKEEVVKPEVVVLTNKLYYKCKIAGQIFDTTETYYKETGKNNCNILDLRDTTESQTLYVNFKNEIRIKNIGAGLDMTSFTITGATFMGSGGWFTVFVKEEGVVKITVKSCWINGDCRQTVILLKGKKLPAPDN